MTELSIIVPIYNVETYLPRCIDSILAQTFTDFELILINDGSPDRCAEIMEAYAKKDARIITIHQENQGVSAARNAGLKIATGKYVGFVDPDDWLNGSMYQIMIQEMEKNHSELVCCNWDNYNEKMLKTIHIIENISPIMDKEEFVIHLFDLPRTLGGTIWNKLFLREKIKNVFDINVCIGEDALFTIMYALEVNKVSYINKSFYHCFERNDSATRKNTDKVALILNVKYQMIELAKSVSEKARRYAEKDYLDSCLLYYNKYMEDSESEYLKLGKIQFHQYMNKYWKKVLINAEIYWKIRLVYLWKLIQKK